MSSDAQAADRKAGSLPANSKSWRIVERAEVGTTQAVAADLAALGERGPVWIRADVQTQGRGRSGRHWQTPSGNFSATLLVAPECPLEVLPQLSLVAGIAVADVLNSFLAEAGGPDRALLKWPNDLLIGDAKICGILVETSLVGRGAVAFIGIGINLAALPEVAGRAVTRLNDHIATTKLPNEVLGRLAPSAHQWLGIWDGGRGFAAIRTAWLDRATPVGTQISINAGAGPVHGTFAGLDTDGTMLLEVQVGVRQRFAWGDVSLDPAKD